MLLEVALGLLGGLAICVALYRSTQFVTQYSSMIGSLMFALGAPLAAILIGAILALDPWFVGILSVVLASITFIAWLRAISRDR